MNSRSTELAHSKYGWDKDFYLNYYSLSSSMVEYEIASYNFQDVSSDLGGQLKLLESVFVVVLFGYPQFSFIMKALSKLYLGKTTNGDILNVRKAKYNKKMSWNKH